MTATGLIGVHGCRCSSRHPGPVETHVVLVCADAVVALAIGR